MYRRRLERDAERKAKEFGTTSEGSYHNMNHNQIQSIFINSVYRPLWIYICESRCEGCNTNSPKGNKTKKTKDDRFISWTQEVIIQTIRIYVRTISFLLLMYRMLIM
jgi:capsid protein